MSEFRFPKKLRLKSNQQFKAVLDHKTCAKNDYFTLFMAKNSLDYPRFGISVGKKFGNAVKRNRLKRIARESCRLLQHDFPSGYDYIVMYSAKMTNNSISNSLKSEKAIRYLKLLLDYIKRRYKIE